MNYILTFCDKSYIVEILLIVKTIFKIACYLAPLLIIIVSSIQIFKVITTGKEDDLKESINTSIKRIIAGLLIFFIPTLLNYVVTGVVNATDYGFLSCFQEATKEKVASLKAKEEAQKEAEKKQQEKEDEKALRAAYEAEQKQKNAKKQTYEEWKKERLNNNNGSNNNSNNTNLVNSLLIEAKNVTDYIRVNNFIYGDAPKNPAINHDAKIVSCDRCVGWFLYKVGYTNQPESQGIVISMFPQWFEENGFKKITSLKDLKAGDIVFVNPDSSGKPTHVFLLGNQVGNGIWERYDCGSVDRIRLTGQYSNYASQPFKEAINGFMFAYRAEGV